MRSANGETRGIRPDITGTLTYTGGTASVTNADIEAKSFAIRTGTSVPDSLSVGAAVMGSVNFTLLNTNGKYDNVVWKGATFTFTLTVVNGNVTNNFPMGTYYVVSHSESGDRIQVQCYDAMKILDEYEIYEDIQNYNLFPNGNPSSIQLIVDSILTQHHNLSYTGLVNPTTGVINPRNDHMSERQLLSYIAQLNGQYIIIRPNAQGTPVVHFEWYDTTTTYDAGTTFSHDLRTNNITITGVKVTAYSGDFSATAGTTDNMIEIEGNPLIVASNCQFFCNRIYSAVNGLTFRPGTVEIRGTPVIEAGDCLIVQTGQESNIKTLVTNLTYTLDLTIQSTADAPPYEGDLNLMRSKYIKNSAKQAISEELNDPNSELAQALGGGGVGDDGCEWIKLPLSKIYMKASSSLVHTFETFKGFTIELDKQDNYHSNITQLIARNPNNSQQDQDGIDVFKVFYPDQYVRVPAINETGRWIELWVGEIIQPSWDDYRDVYGNSFTEARRQARLCKFCSTNTQPARVRIYVQRFKGDNYDYLSFGATPSETGDFSTTDPIRPRVLYNGLQLLDTMPDAISPPNPRIPYVRFYFPGQCYDLLEDNATTYHKWCYRHGQTETGELELIPAYYFYT